MQHAVEGESHGKGKGKMNSFPPKNYTVGRAKSWEICGCDTPPSSEGQSLRMGEWEGG